MHGCNFGSLYGDDGEMQCSKCRLDFKRDSEDRIIEVITERQKASSKDAPLIQTRKKKRGERKVNTRNS